MGEFNHIIPNLCNEKIRNGNSRNFIDYVKSEYSEQRSTIVECCWCHYAIGAATLHGSHPPHPCCCVPYAIGANALQCPSLPMVPCAVCHRYHQTSISPPLSWCCMPYAVFTAIVPLLYNKELLFITIINKENTLIPDGATGAVSQHLWSDHFHDHLLQTECCHAVLTQCLKPSVLLLGWHTVLPWCCLVLKYHIPLFEWIV